MAETVTIHAAKTTLSRLIARVEAGEEVVIGRGRTPVAKLVPVPRKAREHRFGGMRGKIRLNRTAFEPLPESELKGWE